MTTMQFFVRVCVCFYKLKTLGALIGFLEFFSLDCG